MSLEDGRRRLSMMPRTTRGTTLIERRTFGASLLMAGVMFMVACDSSEAKAFRSQVAELVGRNAGLDETIAALGRGHVYEKGTDSWSPLVAYVGNEPKARYPRLGSRMERYPIVLCYSDSEWITWLFFDSKRTLRDWFQEVQ